MKKSTLSIFIIIAFVQITMAQTKLLTMDDAIIKQKTTLAPEKLKQLMWVRGEDSYSYVDTKDSIDILILGKAEGTNKPLKVAVSLIEINDALGNLRFKSLKTFPEIRWKTGDIFTFEAEKNLFAYDLRSKLLTKESSRDFGDNSENIDVANKTNYVAFTVKNNLFVYDGKENLIVTNDANENIVNGKSVHREEFGIVKGTFWSPSGKLLAFYRMDQTMVTDYPIIDWTVRPAKNNAIKYPMAGDTSHQVTVGVYNVNTGKTVFLKTGEPKEQYLTNIAWSPDEQTIYIAVLNRDQNHLKLNSYNVATGLFEKTLFEEKDDKYVEPMHPLVFVPKHPDQFIWQSERDGYNHLYLYDISGKLVKQLTKGNWVITDFAGFDEKGTKAFYSSTAESPITRNFYSLDLKKGKTTKITSGEGTHTVILNNDASYFIDNFQSSIVPREISISNNKGKKVQTIKQSENPLKDYKLGQMSIFKLKSANGNDLYCRMFKPVDFDSTKKYPVIVYLYGGPNVQLVNNTWNGGGDMWLQYMAERGFVVFTMDSRGSSNRGKAFEQATFQHLGTVEMQDQLLGVSFLKNLKYVDANRMGLMGWSFGGFLTTSIMTRYPDLFKAAVAGGPVIDWSYYEIMYTERYMDTPQSNPKGYEETKVLNYADSLKGKLMLIHGTADNVVVWQHSLMFLKTCVDKGKQVDYFVYPGHEHNVLGKDRVHLFNKITDYFIQNL
ncbi:MAG: DPP IV N-terminal domain-containing protein [Bacteroidota bacterium]